MITHLAQKQGKQLKMAQSDGLMTLYVFSA